MAKYSYSAIDTSGTHVNGTESAANVGAARLQLRERGLEPFEVEEKTSILKLEITKKRVPRDEVMNFSRQLAVFVKAGIPILEALEVIAGETDNKLMRGVILDLIDSLQHGDTFAAAVGKHPEAFPNYYVGVLGSAELTGSLDLVLDQLSDYMERDLEARSELISALIYPVIVLGMAVVVIVVLAVVVLPKFKTFFGQLHAKLPLPTRMLLRATTILETWWWLIALVIFGVVGTVIAMRRSRSGKAKLDAILLRLPVIGGLIKAAVVERVCRVLAAMVGAGVALPEAMNVAAESSNNAVYEEALMGVRAQMMEGEGLAGPLAETGLFPGAAQQMFRVGEETGTLETQLTTAAAYYSRELSVKVKHFTSLFEPAVLIFVGAVVGFVAVALVSAMYGIYSQVKT